MRELSANLTEGETLDSQINRFAYTAKIAVNIQIANSHYRQIHRLQVFCAQRLFSGLLCCIMSAAVKFDDRPFLHNRNPQCNYQLLFAFESAPGSLSKNHTIVSVPMGSYSFGVSLQEGYSLYCSLSFSLPPSKIKDFCHLPRQREALVRCKIAHDTLHRTVYRSVSLLVRQISICRFVWFHTIT